MDWKDGHKQICPQLAAGHKEKNESLQQVRRAIRLVDRYNYPDQPNKPNKYKFRIAKEDYDHALALVEEKMMNSDCTPVRHIMRQRVELAKGNASFCHRVEMEEVDPISFLACLMNDGDDPSDLVDVASYFKRKPLAESTLFSVRENYWKHTPEPGSMKLCIALITPQNVFQMCKFIVEDSKKWNISDEEDKGILPFAVSMKLALKANDILQERYKEEREDHLEAVQMVDKGHSSAMMNAIRARRGLKLVDTSVVQTEQADLICQHIMTIACNRTGLPLVTVSDFQKKLYLEMETYLIQTQKEFLKEEIRKKQLEKNDVFTEERLQRQADLQWNLGFRAFPLSSLVVLSPGI